MVFWIIWSALGIVMAILFACLLLPRILLKLHAATLPVRDRAIGRTTDEFGPVLYFEPAASVQKCIKSYRIAHDGEGLYFCGEWAKKIAYAEYELVVYSANGNILDMIRVKEKFNGDPSTHITRLPPKTDYVTVRLICTDDTLVPAERRKFNFRYLIWLVLLCLAFSFAVDLPLWLISNLILRIRFGFNTAVQPSVGAWCALLGYTALGVTLLVCTLALTRFFLLRRRGDDHGE